MSLEWRRDAEPAPRIPNYTGELLNVADKLGLPEGAIDEKDIALTVTLLERMREDYGDPDKETYRHHHNDTHAMNFITCYWMLWKPLWEKFPDTFDIEGFKVGMFIGAGHDLVQSMKGPGQNERASAELVHEMMLEAGYGEKLAQRVYDGIIKTTVELQDGVLAQTYMRKGSKDIAGLIAGQADMNVPLIQGLDMVFGIAFDVWLEDNNIAIDDALKYSTEIADFMAQDEKNYLDSRVAALSDDLKYYVTDPKKRQAIIGVYRNEFERASRESLQAVDSMHTKPDKTKSMVEDSFRFAGKVARVGIDQIKAAKQHMTDQIIHGRQTDS